ncbi:MAG: head-tail adaptor protein [Negativicutes bacterium]
MSAVEITWPDIGELQRRVKIRLWTDNANTGFAITPAFDAGITRWAKLAPVSGIAAWGSKQIGDEITHRVWVRWGTGTKPADITGQHVVDYPAENRRYRVVRTTNAGDAQKFTMIECKDLGAIT